MAAKTLGFAFQGIVPVGRRFSLMLADEECSSAAAATASAGFNLHRSDRSRPLKREISGVIQLYRQGNLAKALEILRTLEGQDTRTVSTAFVKLLRECGRQRCLAHGKQVHAEAMKGGFESDIFVASTLVSVYGKCGSLLDARRVFDRMPERNSVSWNAMISAYARNGDGEEALRLWEEMKFRGFRADRVTFLCIINACATVSSLQQGANAHAAMLEGGFRLDLVMATALIDMYSKCGSLRRAREIFDAMPQRNLISWNAMISGYASHGNGKEALILYHQLKSAGMKPDEVTFSSILHACASSLDLERGKEIHADIIMESGCKLDTFVGNSLIHMYAKCGCSTEALEVFDQMPSKDVITWTTLIRGYSKCGEAFEAIELYKRMKQEKVRPNQVTFLCILDACGSFAALEEGQCVHADVIKSGFESDVAVGTALVDMYAKCGNLKAASEAFYGMPVRNVISWNAMIAGYASHGNADRAFEHFRKMLEENIVPNNTTFVSILSLCSHLGLLDIGQEYFKAMQHEFGVEPTFEHFGCMIDLYGRAGLLEEANVLMTNLSKSPDISLLKCLLSACRSYCDVSLAETTMKLLLQFEPQNAAAYVLLSNIYAAMGMSTEKLELWKVMEDRGVRKQLGHSWI